MSDLVRHTVFKPGFDMRDTDLSKNYGISGGKFIFVVSGPRGAVHFVMSADFYPKSAIDHLVKHHSNNARAMMEYYGPMAFDWRKERWGWKCLHKYFGVGECAKEEEGDSFLYCGQHCPHRQERIEKRNHK